MGMPTLATAGRLLNACFNAHGGQLGLYRRLYNRDSLRGG